MRVVPTERLKVVTIMRTTLGVRMALKRSPISASDWARELGVGHSEIVRLRDGCQNLQHGPLMQRLLRAFAALDEGRVHWEKRPPRRPKGRPYHVLVGPERFTPSTAGLYVDWASGSLVKRRWQEQPVDALPG